MKGCYEFYCGSIDIAGLIIKEDGTAFSYWLGDGGVRNFTGEKIGKLVESENNEFILLYEIDGFNEKGDTDVFIFSDEGNLLRVNTWFLDDYPENPSQEEHSKNPDCFLKVSSIGDEYLNHTYFTTRTGKRKKLSRKDEEIYDEEKKEFEKLNVKWKKLVKF